MSSYGIYHNSTLNPTDWRSQSHTGFIIFFQEETKGVSKYSAHLRHLASTCNFGEFLNCSLRDQFICGIRNIATCKKLLSEDYSFLDALKVTTADEIVAKETLQVQQQQSPQTVNAVCKDSTPLPPLQTVWNFTCTADIEVRC